MKPISAYNVSLLQASQHPGEIIKIEGYFRSSTLIAWLQVHDSVAAPVANAVPLKQWPVYATTEFYKEFKRGSLTCTLGCFVGLSTTEGTYTADVADVMDISVELSDPENPSGTTFVGDLTSAVTGLAVWSEASGVTARKKLLSLEVDGTNLTGGTQWIMIFATDAVTAGQAPLQNMIFPITAGQVRTLNNGLHFGETCRDMSSYDGTNWHYGCHVVISSTASTYTAPNGTACIRGEYRAS